MIRNCVPSGIEPTLSPFGAMRTLNSCLVSPASATVTEAKTPTARRVGGAPSQTMPVIVGLETVGLILVAAGFGLAVVAVGPGLAVGFS